jgi:hypothetical protein
MGDKWSLTLADTRAAYSEIIQFYLEAMRDRERQSDHKLQAAQMAQRALDSYVKILNLTAIQAEIEQTQKLLASWRNSVPDPFEDEGDR